MLLKKQFIIRAVSLKYSCISFFLTNVTKQNLAFEFSAMYNNVENIL